jgi:hypothetical protein
VATTHIAFGLNPGSAQIDANSFPAAATTTTPLLTA